MESGFWAIFFCVATTPPAQIVPAAVGSAGCTGGAWFMVWFAAGCAALFLMVK